MAVIVEDMLMPKVCEQCEFGKRIDNMHVMCDRHPAERPVEPGEGIPKHCSLREVRCKNNENYKLWFLIFLLITISWMITIMTNQINISALIKTPISFILGWNLYSTFRKC